MYSWFAHYVMDGPKKNPHPDRHVRPKNAHKLVKVLPNKERRSCLKHRQERERNQHSRQAQMKSNKSASRPIHKIRPPTSYVQSQVCTSPNTLDVEKPINSLPEALTLST
ncbi:MAG: hypothetical protein CL920_25565, partial [Deltaproteobacteria bacterium]|nr:hypothetical protein [Deltaproteobacteria bacterium]